MNMLGLGAGVDIEALMTQGAQIIDVRTPAEFRRGNIKGSLNLPLDSLQRQLHKIEKGKPVITCCRSGARSASAKRMLKAHGYSEVYNGGGWSDLQRKIGKSKNI
jgi:phage shock protein E